MHSGFVYFVPLARDFMYGSCSLNAAHCCHVQLLNNRERLQVSRLSHATDRGNEVKEDVSYSLLKLKFAGLMTR